MSMSVEEFNKSRKNDAVLEESGSKSVATQTSPIQKPNNKDTWRCEYFTLMDRIQKTLDEGEELQMKKTPSFEEGTSKIWCKCYKCGEKAWYRSGDFKNSDFFSCDYCGGDLHDVLGGIVNEKRVFYRYSE